MATVSRSPNDVGVLQKALDVLEAVVSGAPMTLVEASKTTDLGKPTVYRILNTFEARSYLLKDPATHRYRPGPTLLKLAIKVVDSVDVVRLALEPMASLFEEFGETVNLGIPVDSHVEYVRVMESPHSLRMASRLGSVDLLHSTALGKAVLAWLPTEVGKELVENAGMVTMTPNTLTDWPALAAELERTRRRGWAIDEEENEVGARCIAAPILDVNGRPVAALSVSGPTSRMTTDKVLRIADELSRMASDVSAMLGSARNCRAGAADSGQEGTQPPST